MDVYRALNADVPQLLFTVMHQAGPTVSDEEFTRTVTALQMDIRKQVHEVGERLHQWLLQQYSQQAEETLQKLQRQGVLSDNADVGEIQQILERDYSRLGSRVGSETVLGLQGTSEETFSEAIATDPDLSKRVADGREYVASLGFKPGRGPLDEAWLCFPGSIHYSDFRHEVSALMEHIAEPINLKHASFWQRKLGLGTGKEFVLRLRLPAGEETLRGLISTIAGSGRVGKEIIVKRGKLLLGTRVL